MPVSQTKLVMLNKSMPTVEARTHSFLMLKCIRNHSSTSIWNGDIHDSEEETKLNLDAYFYIIQ